MRKLLMIPGPIEYESNVLNAMSLPTISHSSPEFISIYREALQNVSTVFGSDVTDSLPFIISGSGTLGMEVSTVNFIKRDSKVLVVNTGYFGDRFVELFSRFTDKIEQIRPPLGEAAEPGVIKEKLETNEYEMMTVTHVDTSTGVRNDVRKIAEASRGSETLLVVDGVCSVGGEEFDMKWGIDVAFTASQKALGTPPGLAVGVAGKRALERMANVKPLTFFSDLRKWEAVSRGVLASNGGYFGTPNVNLITALGVSLSNILNEGMEKRIARHRLMSSALRAGIEGMGLEIMAKKLFANTVSAVYLPEGADSKKFLSDAEKMGVVFASGLIRGIAGKYFRIGHMGSINSTEVLLSLSAIERALNKGGKNIRTGSGLIAAEEVLLKSD